MKSDKTNKKAQSLGALHTHTHTHTFSFTERMEAFY